MPQGFSGHLPASQRAWSLSLAQGAMCTPTSKAEASP